MSARQRKLLWPVCVLIVATAGLTLISVRAGTSEKDSAKQIHTAPLTSASPFAQANATPSIDFRSRLARQPEAFKQAEKLGRRFLNERRVDSVMVGNLSGNGEEQRVRIVRRQNSTGEQVEIALGNGANIFTWSASEGFVSSGELSTVNDRVIIERLVLDSPDQFVLAQFRGASYQVVGRFVRPAEAGAADDYNGPTWDIVRVSEPVGDTTHRAQSGWRLFYINTATGLIDRIISPEQGGTVTAEFSEWVNRQGELVPSRITWTQQGQTIMQLDLTNFSHGASNN